MIKTKPAENDKGFSSSVLKYQNAHAEKKANVGITKPDVKKSLNSFLSNLKNSTLVECTMPY